MSVKPLVLLPTYNNASTLENILSELKKRNLNYVVINDGSTDETEDVIARQSCLNILRFSKNRGKGAALRAGFTYARDRGFTHAITMDTDGQHSADDLQKFFDFMETSPKTLVIGERDFQENVPFSSKFGRTFSNFWVKTETGHTLSDTQSGFRAYPLADLPFDDTKTSRYDFEIEILARAAWANIPLKTIPISVYYPPKEERISHFRKWEDNARLSLLHTRLVTRRLFKGSRKERRGAGFMKFVMPLLGKHVSYLIAPLVVFFYFLTGGAQRRAIAEFHEHLGTRGLKKVWHTYLTFVYFASVLVDRALMTMGGLKTSQNITVHGDTVPHTGVILVGAHLGDWLVPAFGYFRKRGRRVVVVMNKLASPQFQRLAKNYHGSPLEILDSSSNRIEVVLKAKEALADNAVLCVLVDRPEGDMRSETAPFLGEAARWASGPFELAMLLKAPVFSFLAAKTHPFWKAPHHVFFNQLFDGQTPSDTQTLIAKFADRLALTAKAFRFQWYNFFQFWMAK